MKTNIYLILITALIFSCQTPNTVQIDDSEWSGTISASDETVEIAKTMVNAYSNKDFDLVNQYSADTVYFKPPQGGEYIPIPIPANDFLAMLTDPYDSIVRNIRSIVPLKREEGDNAGVYINFDETTYGKDGTVTKSNIIDRMWVRDGKVYRIEQWVAESN
jgi:ketosteroid isomerase-like protein